MEIQTLHETATTAARTAADALYAQIGDRYPCGFAWVTYYPKHKGNTAAGKAERKLFESIGFSKDWTGKAWQLRNPSRHITQNMDVKEAGAVAYAKVFRDAGYNVYSETRID